MSKIFTINFWIGLLASTFLTMCGIYLIKKLNSKMPLPVVNDIVQSV